MPELNISSQNCSIRYIRLVAFISPLAIPLLRVSLEAPGRGMLKVVH
nr:MAG TPA: hypothetical protein [Caudoviricetes sp.]